jgi:hypothetical protein
LITPATAFLASTRQNIDIIPKEAEQPGISRSL